MVEIHDGRPSGFRIKIDLGAELPVQEAPQDPQLGPEIHAPTRLTCAVQFQASMEAEFTGGLEGVVRITW